MDEIGGTSNGGANGERSSTSTSETDRLPDDERKFSRSSSALSAAASRSASAASVQKQQHRNKRV